jgi:hypothetical protein
LNPRHLIAVGLASTLTLTCSLVGRLADAADSVVTPPMTADALDRATPTVSAPATPTPPASLETLYMPYASSGQQAWHLGTGGPVQVDLPVSVGSFYGYSLATDRILFAQVFTTHGAGPGPISVSDLSILDLATGSVEVLLPDNVVEAMWAPNGRDLAYILATPSTFELHWRDGAGDDRLLARDVTFNWNLSPAGDAIAFTRESRYALTVEPGLYVVGVDSGVEVKVSDADAQGFGSVSDQPIWSPDGAWVALPIWATEQARVSLAPADGSGAVDLQIDPALASEWWATAAIPNFVWHPDGKHLVAAPAASQTEMGGPVPLVAYTLDVEAGMLREGRLIAEVGSLIGWDVPGQSVWVTSVDGIPERLALP